MSQEDRPKFSHITVGQTTDDESALPDDEEVISIGAVGDGAASSSNLGFDTDYTVEGNEAVGTSGTVGAGGTSGTSGTVDADSAGGGDDDDELGAPMPLAQRIVIVGCAIGLIVVIAFLVWYWLIA